MSEPLLLSGLDGSNPLGFLAALGAFRVIARILPDETVKLAWTAHRGTWSPLIHSTIGVDAARFTDILYGGLGRDARLHAVAFMESMQGASPADLHRLFLERARAAQVGDRDHLDWLSALASDVACEATSQLQTTRRDYYWGNLQSVVRLAEPDHLRRTLFERWDYADPLDNQSLHLEPGEDRRHAYQWSKPSGDPARKKRGGMLGANRLAIEALPLFQSLPFGDRLTTRGFNGTRSDNTRWTWPIWSGPLGIEVVSSLMAARELQNERPDATLLRALGIATAFRCRRILVEKTPNFTPTIAV